MKKFIQEYFKNTGLEGSELDAQVESFAKMMDECVTIKAEAIASDKIQKATADLETKLSAKERDGMPAETRKFIQAMIDNGGLDGLEYVLPKTIIDRVWEDIEHDTGLGFLYEINFTRSNLLLQTWRANLDHITASWGKICSLPEEVNKPTFKIVDNALKKLSTFITICKDLNDEAEIDIERMLVLAIREGVIRGIKDGVLYGDGYMSPVGMNRTAEIAGDGTYVEKTPIKMFTLSKNAWDTQIIPALVKDSRRTNQVTSNLTMLVDDMTYFEKVAPFEEMQNVNGQLIAVLPRGIRIIRDSALEPNTAIVGNLNEYLMYVKSGEIKIEKYRETLADLELDLYTARFLGTGWPREENSFVVLDLTDVDTSVISAREQIIGGN